ncbi:hypothetical protein [Sporosarcina sp. FA9]|uniref:hypothetical protein n=1 Tax=Sporosarcina sp. FA9 TaxID=3413030 RepID=UPI003F65663F
MVALQIGKRIYFDVFTGNVIVDTGERQGAVFETTLAQDVIIYTELTERNPEMFGVLELPFGAYAQDFAESNGYRVNVETKTLEFSYPDPNEPEEPQPYQVPLSIEVEQLKVDLGNAKTQSTQTDTVLMEFMNYYFENGGM